MVLVLALIDIDTHFFVLFNDFGFAVLGLNNMLILLKIETFNMSATIGPNWINNLLFANYVD